MERDELNVRIGERLRHIRQSRNLSLDGLAAATGVSKPMLGQIERGTSNPTVATLWKIALGLNVPFTTFVSEESAAKLVPADKQSVFYEDENRYQVFSTYTAPAGQVELFRMHLLPGAKREAEAHAPGVVECLTVSSGRLVVTVGGVSYQMSTGDALQFHADTAHIYENPFSSPCDAHLAILYALGTM
jgi:XRE family transcriptional regulator, regulator of sulfur utilization